MYQIIKDLFDEIPKFDQENAVAILQENCEKISDQLLTVSTTTLDSEEESLYGTANSDLLHTRYKEIEMAVQSYKEWEQNNSAENWESYQKIYTSAMHHIKINLTNFI